MLLFVLFIPFFVFGFGRHSYKNTKILRNMFVYIFKSLALLALQTETIVKKITQPKLPKTKMNLPKFIMSRTRVKFVVN